MMLVESPPHTSTWTRGLGGGCGCLRASLGTLRAAQSGCSSNIKPFRADRALALAPPPLFVCLSGIPEVGRGGNPSPPPIRWRPACESALCRTKIYVSHCVRSDVMPNGVQKAARPAKRIRAPSHRNVCVTSRPTGERLPNLSAGEASHAPLAPSPEWKGERRFALYRRASFD